MTAEWAAQSDTGWEAALAAWAAREQRGQHGLGLQCHIVRCGGASSGSQGAEAFPLEGGMVGGALHTGARS